MSFSGAVAIKDLRPLIQEYLDEKHEAAVYFKSSEIFYSDKFNTFYSKLHYLKYNLNYYNDDNEVIKDELLELYHYLHDFNSLDSNKFDAFEKLLSLLEEKVMNKFYFGFELEGQKKVVIEYDIVAVGRKGFILRVDPIQLREFQTNLSSSSNLTGKVMKIDDVSFLPDENIHVRLLEDPTKLNICVYGKEHGPLSNISIFGNSEDDPLLIRIISKPDGFEQRADMVSELTSGYCGPVFINYKVESVTRRRSPCRFIMTCSAKRWKEKFSNAYSETCYKIKYKTPDNELIDVHIKSSLENQLLIDMIKYHEDEINFDVIGHIQASNYMVFDVKENDPPPKSHFESFKVNLTEKGEYQLKILERQFLTDSSIVRESNAFYAPFTSLIQASGSGKSKLCVELLRKYPGIYMVFRKQGETGIPNQCKWMKDMFDFVLDTSEKNLIPVSMSSQAVYCASTRFLLALEHLIAKYLEILNEKFKETDEDREKAIEEVAKLMINDPSAISSLNDFEVDFYALIKDRSTVEEVISRLEAHLNPRRRDDLMMEGPDSEFPFFLFLDSAQNLNEMKGKAPIPCLNIIRHGLHLLDSDIRLLVVTIGTDPSVVNFVPSPNAFEFPEKRFNLPPFFLSINWDIYSQELPYDKIEINESNLLNPEMFKVLVTLGKPIWSSTTLNDVVALVHAKLTHGDRSKLSALFAQLMIRVNHSVIPSHPLSKTLTRSYMANIMNMSIDGKAIYISYSSEPVLAIAARNLLEGDCGRFRAFFAFKVFLQCDAVENVQKLETIFEHLTLFAIDDADYCTIYQEDSDHSSFPESFGELFKCTNHLLEIKRPSNTRSMRPSYLYDRSYRIVTVCSFLIKLVGQQEFDEIKPFISAEILDGYVNATHFVNLKRLNKSQFKGLRGQIEEEEEIFIDRAILQVGLLRQCGFVMPHGYLGINFIIPVLMKIEERPVYSYIGVQTKDSSIDANSISEEMNPSVHYNCTSEKGKEDLEEILAESLVITMTYKSRDSSRSFDPSKYDRIKLNSKDYNAIFDQINPREAAILKRIGKKKSLIVSKLGTVDASAVEFPNLIITQKINSKLTVHRMSWDKKSHSMTAIMIHDIHVMNSLVDANTFVLIDEIVNFNPSSLEDDLNEFYSKYYAKETAVILRARNMRDGIEEATFSQFENLYRSIYGRFYGD